MKEETTTEKITSIKNKLFLTKDDVRFLITNDQDGYSKAFVDSIYRAMLNYQEEKCKEKKLIVPYKKYIVTAIALDYLQLYQNIK